MTFTLSEGPGRGAGSSGWEPTYTCVTCVDAVVVSHGGARLHGDE